MTVRADVAVDVAGAPLGTIDERIYGQLIEQMGRVIHGGLFDPESPFANADGFRTDTLEAVRGLRPSVLRLGGNWSSGYHWRDGVGPVESRPHRRDLAWGNVWPNTFGTDEFVRLARAIGAEPYISANLGTGTMDEAVGWLEYCNGREAGIPEVDLRGGPPHDVLIWGLGNELYGWWQHRTMSASQYGEAARDYGKLLRWTDNRVRLVACGNIEDPDWNWTVLDTAGLAIDWISLHPYWMGDASDRLLGPGRSEQVIVETWDMCVEAARKHRVPRPIKIAIDEWNVWTKTFPKELFGPDGSPLAMERGFRGAFGDTDFEESYDFVDALTVASWLHVMWRHPEKITLANQAQMVNTIAPILTSADQVVRQTTYWPLALARRFAGTESLRVSVRGDADIDVAATLDTASGRVHVSLVNRSFKDDVEVCLGLGEAEVATLRAEPDTSNTFEQPDVVVPVDGGRVDTSRLALPALSHTTVVA